MKWILRIQIVFILWAFITFGIALLNAHLNVISSILGLGLSITLYLSFLNQFQNWLKPIDDYLDQNFKKIVFLLFISSPFLLFHFLFFINFQSQGLFIGDPFNYGDMGFHIGQINYFFREGALWPDNPNFANHPLKYPFLVDFFNAVLMKLGASLQFSFIIVGGISFISLFILLMYWGGLWGTLFVLLSSGLYEWSTLSSQSVFTIYEHIDFKSFFLSLFIPQRGLLWGLPLVLLILQFLKHIWGNGKLDFKNLLVVSILWGILAYIHVHSFFVISLFILYFLVFHRKFKDFFVLASLAFLISIPYWNTVLLERIDTFNFIRLEYFWNWNKQESIFSYILKNWGVLIGLIFFNYDYIKKMDIFSKLVFRFGLFILIFGHFVILAPWAWDNIKILIWGYIFIIFVVAQSIQRFKYYPVFYILLAPGFIVLWKFSPIHSGYNSIQSWTDQIQSELLMKYTAPNKKTLIAPVANHPVILSGQTVLLGYTGHVWSQGYKMQDLENELKSVNGQLEVLKNIILKYNIEVVVWGEHEKNYFKIDNPDSLLESDWRKWVQNDHFKIYQKSTSITE